MVSRGARNLILLSRRGAQSDEAKMLLDDLNAIGVRVEVPICDVTNLDELQRALESCSKDMPAIAGCIQASMVLQDALFENMTHEQWKSSIDPKVKGSWNLHALLPKGLGFFVLLSSICGLIGQGGQANYASGNTYMDALAHYRINNGESAVSIDLGVMVTDGFLVENEHLLDRMLAPKLYTPLTESELFAALDHYCDPTSAPRLEIDACQTVMGIEVPAILKASGVEEAHWMQTPLFRHLHKIPNPNADSSMPNSSLPETNQPDSKTLIKSSASLVEANTIVVQALTKKLLKTLSSTTSASSNVVLDSDRPLHYIGVDSLLAVELRTWIEREFGVDMPVFEILGGASLSAVALAVTRKCWEALEKEDAN
jgi:acyl carrier protein